MNQEGKARAKRPLALVYRGPASCSGCSEAAAALLQSSRWDFAIQYVGPQERRQLSESAFEGATLYVQPGGNGTVEEAFAALRGYARAIRQFVKNGGRYLGFCMGGYLAGTTPGFHLLPADTDQFITSAGASVRTEADTVVKVYWRDQPRYMYFQDGPYFPLPRAPKGTTVLATYTNRTIAALVTPFGKGSVGVVGPHPEATVDWYAEHSLVDPDGPDADLGHDLIDTLMSL